MTLLAGAPGRLPLIVAYGVYKGYPESLMLISQRTISTTIVGRYHWIPVSAPERTVALQELLNTIKDSNGCITNFLKILSTI